MERSNPYDKWAGYGQVSGRDQIMLLDDKDEETGETLDPDDPDIEELDDYIPLPGVQNKVRFVIRWAPPVTAPADSHLRLLLAGAWSEGSRRSLEALRFRYANAEDSLFLESDTDIELATANWNAYDKVIIKELFLPDEGIVKLYSRVKFVRTGTAGKETRVAAYWCWPY